MSPIEAGGFRQPDPISLSSSQTNEFIRISTCIGHPSFFLTVQQVPEPVPHEMYGLHRHSLVLLPDLLGGFCGDAECEGMLMALAINGDDGACLDIVHMRLFVGEAGAHYIGALEDELDGAGVGDEFRVQVGVGVDGF